MKDQRESQEMSATESADPLVATACDVTPLSEATAEQAQSTLPAKRPVEGVAPIAHTREQRLAVMDEICVLIANGKGLKRICEENPQYPSRVTILRWCGQDPEIATMYRSALSMRAELYADEMEEMAQEARGKAAEEVQAIKLIVNTRQWIASRLLPKMYGDKQLIEHSGEVQLNPDQIDQRLAVLVKRMGAIEVKK